jgi:hypothetical protein
MILYSMITDECIIFFIIYNRLGLTAHGATSSPRTNRQYLQLIEGLSANGCHHARFPAMCDIALKRHRHMLFSHMTKIIPLLRPKSEWRRSGLFSRRER